MSKAKTEIVAAKIVWIVAESFMENDYPKKGVDKIFNVGAIVEDPDIIDRRKVFLTRDLEEAPDVKIGGGDKVQKDLEKATAELEKAATQITELKEAVEKQQEQLKAKDTELKEAVKKLAAAEKKIEKLTAK